MSTFGAVIRGLGDAAGGWPNLQGLGKEPRSLVAKVVVVQAQLAQRPGVLPG